MDRPGTSKLERERRTLTAMVRMHCRRRHASRSLCDECRQLLDYACARLAHCPYGDGKPSCRRCPTPCYAADARERIRAVMRWAGPRMLFRHPRLALGHLRAERRLAQTTKVRQSVPAGPNPS